MMASDLIGLLRTAMERDGDQEVYIEAELSGDRTCQKAVDLLTSASRMIICSQEATDADPLLALPVMPDLSLIEGDGLPQ